jgi:hypothetical protein
MPVYKLQTVESDTTQQLLLQLTVYFTLLLPATCVCLSAVSIGTIFSLKYYLLMKVKHTVGSIVVDCEICIEYLKYCDDDDDNNNNRSLWRKPIFYK